MALSLSSIIKWILCLIGGLPLLQLLAHTFNDLPIPFARGAKFPPESIKKIIDKINKLKEDAQNLKDTIQQEIKKNFTLPADIKSGLEAAEAELRNIDNKLAEACPFLFSKTGDVQVARQRLLDKLGDITQYANEKQFLGKSLRDWSDMANDGTLADTIAAYRGHASEIAGVLSDDEVLLLEPIPGYPLIGVANTTNGSNLISVNLNYSTYPVTNIGSRIIVANTAYIVTNKVHTNTDSYVALNANSTIVYTKNLETFNLANTKMSSTSPLVLKPGLSINVNSEIVRVNTINALGDYLTVSSPITYPSSNARILVETALYSNTNIDQDTTNTLIKIENYNHANSECLGDVITGNGSSFLTYFSVGDLVYYDEKEFEVLSLTQNTLVIDDRLRDLTNQTVYKIKKKVPVQRTAEGNGPDAILATFDLADQMSAGLGDSFVQGLTARYKKADGSTARIDAWKPIHVTTAVQPGKAIILNRVKSKLQDLFDDLQDDVIRELEDSELVQYLEDKENEIEEIRRDLEDTINADKAAIKSVKNLISGLLKMFKISCSKKKKGDDPDDPDLSSDEYLNLILTPNPERQGCQATESDFIDLIDEADDEYNTIVLPPGRTDIPAATTANTTLFDPPDSAFYGFDSPGTPGDNADIDIDRTPDDFLPERKDPCVEPC